MIHDNYEGFKELEEIIQEEVEGENCEKGEDCEKEQEVRKEDLQEDVGETDTTFADDLDPS